MERAMIDPEQIHSWGVGNAGMRPNVLVWGVAHSNTTITVKQLAALGWNLGDADEKYGESVSIRDFNRTEPPGGEYDFQRQVSLLRALPQPWVLKEPFMIWTIDRWMDALAEFKPCLLWIVKDTALVRASHVRRGEDDRHVETHLELAEAVYQAWPWWSMRLTTDQVCLAVRIFDCERGCGHPTQ